MSTTETTGTRDVTYNLISVVYHALQGAETYQIYEQDAKQSGDREAGRPPRRTGRPALARRSSIECPRSASA